MNNAIFFMCSMNSDRLYGQPKNPSNKAVAMLFKPYLLRIHRWIALAAAIPLFATSSEWGLPGATGLVVVG
jgi:hypothetical protein